MITYRDANKSDIDHLSKLAKLCFIDTFSHLYSKDNLSEHLQKTCSSEFFHKSLMQDRIIVAENNDMLVGYIKFGDVELPIEPILGASKEIHRLYVHPDFQRKKLGRELMQKAFNDPILKKAKHHYLSVYEDNLPAQKFYKNYGFSIISEYNYYVGSHIDLEFIMYKRHRIENE